MTYAVVHLRRQGLATLISPLTWNWN